MNGLQTLKEIGATTIFERSHISVAEVNAILQKDFDYFNRAKALGFIKILERDYDVDLSDWVAEFEAHKGQEENGAIFVYAKEEQGRGVQLGVVAVIAFVVLLIASFYWMNAGGETEVQPVAENNHNTLVAEAKEALNNNEPEEVLTPVEPVAPEVVEEPAATEFYLTSQEDLWVGIYYSDTAQRDGKIIKGRIDFDPSRDQILTFGHGKFKLVHQDQVIEPNSSGLQRFRYREGLLTQMAAPQPNRAKSQEQNQTVSETE